VKERAKIPLFLNVERAYMKEASEKSVVP